MEEVCVKKYEQFYFIIVRSPLDFQLEKNASLNKQTKLTPNGMKKNDARKLLMNISMKWIIFSHIHNEMSLYLTA